MGDSTEMTVEFLRARLLSERSVSRSAKQRAAQLAKRVMELEEQLRIVTLQRKKAEKAAAEVLAILETRRIGDLSEAIEWDSERDGPSRNGGGDILKGNESSTASRTEKSEVEDGFSGSEPEISPSQGNKLSWKNRSENSDSYDKQRQKEIKQRQREISFKPSLKSLPKRHSGKSCRKIVRRDTGSTTESEKHMPSIPDACVNGAVSWPNSSHEYPEIRAEASKGEREETLADVVDEQNTETSDGPYVNGTGADNEMERVLEQQAQFIGQFQAEENAQREWEEKYNKKNMSTQEAYYENGNPFSLAGNSSQNGESSEATDRTPHYVEESKPSGNNSNREKTAIDDTSSENSSRLKKTLDSLFSNGFVATNQINGNTNKSKARMNETKSSHQEFAFPALQHSGKMAKVKQRERLSGDHYDKGSHNNPRLQSNQHATRENSAQIRMENQSNHQRQLPPASLNSLGVLESLQRAKVSLQELNKLPSPRQGTLAIATPPNSGLKSVKSGDLSDIPTGSAGLFRLPFDSFPQAQFLRPKFYTSELGLSAGVHEARYANTNGFYSLQNPSYTPVVEPRSRDLLGKGYYDLSSSMGAPNSNMYSSRFPELSAEGTPSRSELLKSYSDVRSGTRSEDLYGLYGPDNSRSNTRM